MQDGSGSQHPPAAASGSHDEYERERASYFTSPVHALEPRAGTSGPALYRAMHRAGGPLRNLAGVYLGWEEMLSLPHQAVWLTIAGAYIPFGLGGTLRTI